MTLKTMYSIYPLKFKRPTGFGLIELLIAIALSSVVAIVVVQLFIQNKQSYLVQESLTRAQENGKYAINLLTNAAKSTDFWGCVPASQPDTQSGLFAWPEKGIINKVNGLAGGFLGISGAEGAATTGLAGYPAQPDTLILSGLRRGRSFPITQKIGQEDTGPITINLGTGSESNINVNELLVISDCAKAVIFQATNDVDATATTGNTPNTATIERSTTPFATTPPSPFNNSESELRESFSPENSMVYRGVSTRVTYTIDPAFDHDGVASTPTIPTLTQSINGNAAVALVPGVETMQIMYGIDTDVPYDFEANGYVSATNVTNWEDVVSVRISLLVRSPDADNTTAPGYRLEGVDVTSANIPPAANGNFHTRKVYSTTIAIRNRTS